MRSPVSGFQSLKEESVVLLGRIISGLSTKRMSSLLRCYLLPSPPKTQLSFVSTRVKLARRHLKSTLVDRVKRTTLYRPRT